MSQEEQNKAVFYRWFNEAWNQGEYAVAHEIISPQMQVHGAGGQRIEMGPEGLIGLIEAWRKAFSDGHMDVDGVVAEGDIVTALLTWRGTHDGDFYGIPPTGKKVVCTSVGIDGMAGGIINAGWGELDMAGMMQQLGAMPMAGPGATAQGKSAEWGAPSAAPRDENPDPEANKATLLRFVEAINKGDRDGALATIDTANYVEHNPVWGSTDLESSLNVYRTLRAALPDMQFTVDPELTIAENDMAVVHGTVTGTHTGADLFGTPASGKKLDWTHSDVARLASGKIVERWVSADTLRALQQAGVLPGGG
jgi:predicted ester cyclase